MEWHSVSCSEGGRMRYMYVTYMRLILVASPGYLNARYKGVETKKANDTAYERLRRDNLGH